MNPVVIEFTDKGIEEITAKLVSIGAIDAKQAADFKAANAAFKERQAIIDATASSQSKVSTETNKTSKSMDDLSKAAANVTKTIVSGGVNETITKTTGLIDKTTQAATKQSNIFRQLKKDYNDLVAGAENAYAAGNKAFGDELIAKAGEIQDRISDIRQQTKAYASDTATFDAIGAGIRGIGAGFQVAQGAQALFGAGNEDLQKQLIKIQGTMALVNGLTEIQNLLQKESALRIGLTNATRFTENALARIGITFKTAENVAEGTGETIKKRVIVVQAIENGLTSESVIVRGAATAAQWLLNSAMLAFPLIAIIAGLAVVIGLFGGFGESLNDAAEQTLKLNAIQKENLELMKQQDDFINKFSADRAAQIQRELDLLTSQRASTDDIRAKEKELADERNRNAQYQKGFHLQEIDDLEKNRLALIGLQAALASYNKAKALKGDDTYDKQIEALKSSVENLQSIVKMGEDTANNAANESLKLTEERINAGKQLELEGLAQQKSVIDAKLRFAKEGSEQQLALQLAAAKNEYDTQIANLKAANESTADIEAQYREKQLVLNEAFQNAQLNKRKSIITAELTEVRIGSGAELDLKLKALEVENALELNNRKLTDEKKRELTATYLKSVNDMLADFAKKQTDNELNTQINLNNAKLAILEQGSQRGFELQQKINTLNEQLELNNIDRNVKDTELGESMKAAIIAKYNQKNIDSQKAYFEILLKYRENDLNESSAFLQKQADLEAANVNTTLDRKQALELEAFDNHQAQADKQLEIDSERYLNGELNEKEYYEILAKYQDDYITNKQAKQNAADEQERENLLRNLDNANQIATDALNAASTIVQSNLDVRLDAYSKEAAANEKLYADKKETEQQYNQNKNEIDAKVRASKKKAAQADKDISLFQIAIASAEAAIKAIATAPNYIIGAVEAGLALAFGAVQYAAVAAKPIPEFAKGTENAPKGWAWVGERGPELIWMKGGEKVRTHEASKKMAADATPTLRNTFYDKVDRSPVPSQQAKEAMQLLSGGAGGVSIDYNMLSKMIGKEVGNHLNKMPITNFSFDRNGFQASIIEGNTTTNFLDSRYSSN